MFDPGSFMIGVGVMAALSMLAQSAERRLCREKSNAQSTLITVQANIIVDQGLMLGEAEMIIRQFLEDGPGGTSVYGLDRAMRLIDKRRKLN